MNTELVEMQIELKLTQRRNSELEAQLAEKEAQVEALRSYVTDVRDVLLTPLGNCDSEFGRVAEGLGQQTVSLLSEGKAKETT